MMTEELLLWGIFILLCGIFILCVAAVAVTVPAISQSRKNEEKEKEAAVIMDNGTGKMDSAILKQWNNLLGYNGEEGEDIDE